MMLFMLLLMITIQHSAAAISRKTENDNLIGEQINLTANYSFITLLIPVFFLPGRQQDFLTENFHQSIVKLRQLQHKIYFRETAEKYRDIEHEGKLADFGASGLYSLQIQLNVPLQKSYSSS